MSAKPSHKKANAKNPELADSIQRTNSSRTIERNTMYLSRGQLSNRFFNGVKFGARDSFHLFLIFVEDKGRCHPDAKFLTEVFEFFVAIHPIKCHLQKRGGTSWPHAFPVAKGNRGMHSSKQLYYRQQSSLT
jgi:hypothetical protein